MPVGAASCGAASQSPSRPASPPPVEVFKRPLRRAVPAGSTSKPRPSCMQVIQGQTSGEAPAETIGCRWKT